MKQFSLAFPLPFAQDETWTWMIEKGWIPHAPEGKELWLKGISFAFTVHLQPPHPDLAGIFAEHATLEASDRAVLSSHRSVLFLLGTLKNSKDFEVVQQAIELLLSGGALGVACEHCGAAHMRAAWLNGYEGYTMGGWLNWINAKGDLRTLGLDVFNMPELVIQATESDDDALELLLLSVAESMFLDGTSMQSGHLVQGDDGTEYLLRTEPKSPYAKSDLRHNAKGSLRLVRLKKESEKC